MKVIAKKELMNEDWKTQWARGYSNIPKDTELDVIDEITNFYGFHYVVMYEGNRYYIRPCDVKEKEMTKEEYLKKHNVSEKEFLIYCANCLDNRFMNEDDNMNDLKGFLYELINEHFNNSQIKNLGEKENVEEDFAKETYEVIHKISSGINDQKELIIKSWITGNLEEINKNISYEVYSFEDLIKKLQDYESVKKENKKLNKALDKAINEIMTYQTLCPPTDYLDLKNEEEWREELLKDES